MTWPACYLAYLSTHFKPFVSVIYVYKLNIQWKDNIIDNDSLEESRVEFKLLRLISALLSMNNEEKVSRKM